MKKGRGIRTKMSKKKNTETTDCVCGCTNRELQGATQYEELKLRVKAFIKEAGELIDVQDSLIRNERRYTSAKEKFDFSLKMLRDTMENQKV